MTTTSKPRWSPLIILALVALVVTLFSLLVMEKATDKVAVMVDGEVQEQRIHPHGHHLAQRLPRPGRPKSLRIWSTP